MWAASEAPPEQRRPPRRADGRHRQDAGPGATLYQQTCAVCHMADGSGVPNMQPALVGSRVLAGEPATLIRLLLVGPAKALPADRPRAANQMPSFEWLNDAQIADVLNYARGTFAGKPGGITAAEVAASRRGQ